jgi:hypothetical protein
MTTQKQKPKRATLRTQSSMMLSVDFDAGIIRGVAIMTIGEASGHGFTIDRKSLQQLHDLIKQRGSVNVRVGHPASDGHVLLTQAGIIKNPSIVGNVLRGDLHLLDYSENVPGLGDVRSYFLSLAENNPTAIGMSAVIDYTPEMSGRGLPVARISNVEAVDLVGYPAANRNGLLSMKASLSMNLKDVLVADYGLSPDATDEQAQAFYDLLDDESKAEIDGKVDGTAAPALAPAGGTTDILSRVDSAALAEVKRANGVRAMAAALHIPQKDSELIVAQGLSVADSRKAILAYATKNYGPITGVAVTVGEDRNRATLSVAVTHALANKCNLKIKQPHARAEQFAGMSTLEMGRRFYEAQGIDLTGLSRATLARMLLNPRTAPEHVRRAMLAQSTSDFDNVLSTNFNIAMRMGYDESPVTWTDWAKRGTLPDFTTGERPILSAATTPELTLEGGPVVYSTLGDKRETIVLAKYTRGIRLTLEAVINDRLGAFANIFEKFGAASRRLEDDLAYLPITSNQTMTETGNALFHSSHANIVSATASIGAPTVATLSATRVLLSKQTGLKSEYLNLAPATILVPVELATATEILVASMVNPAGTNDSPNAEFIRRLKVVSNARLSAASTTAWYLAASPSAIDGVEVAFLEDEPAPVMRSETDFDTEDAKYAVRHCVGTRALDYRGFAKNPGA